MGNMALSGTSVARPAHISDEEWALRIELAAAYRIFDHLGWVELIYNHITARVPGPETQFLINPFGLMYNEVTAANLVKIDLAGNVIGDSDWPINPAGFVIHSAIHENVPEAHCVMHTHTTEGMAVACTESGLDWNNFYSAQIYKQVAYHDFEGITVEEDEKQRLLASLGDQRLLILRNHGLLSWGETIPEALVRLWTLNRACQIQMAAESLPGGSIPLSEDVRQQCSRVSLQFDPKYGGGRDVFDALRRQVDMDIQRSGLPYSG
jgi:ribulose-5-phosphate 4-epimerase/fuculose-1-phosphate aldolase